jgi:Tfp pilus assembly protein PilN
VQHLNFYSQLDRTVEPPFSARQQLWLVAAVVVVVVLVYILLLFTNHASDGQRASLQQQQQQMEVQLEQLRAKKTRLQQDEALSTEITVLRDEIKFRRQLLASIDPNSALLEKGFADHLEGLARQTIRGMWFTEIQLQQGGRQLALTGRARAPEYVPQFLQKLAVEPVFSGHQFRVFKLNVPEQQEHQYLLDFELRANEEDKPR